MRSLSEKKKTGKIIKKLHAQQALIVGLCLLEHLERSVICIYNLNKKSKKKKGRQRGHTACELKKKPPP